MAFSCSCLFRDSLHHKMRWRKKRGQTPHRMSILWFRDKDNVTVNAIEPMTKLTIIESVDSICRDSADTQYMLIQFSQNLLNN